MKQILTVPFLFILTASHANTVDIMILLTPKYAANIEGISPERYAQTMIERSNEVYAQNHVNIRLRLVHTAVIDRENNEIAGGLEGLAQLSTVKAWREEFKADLVHLLYKSSSNRCTGISSIPNDLERTGRVSERLAFSSSNHICSIDPPLIFIHELGHNMGLAHLRAQDRRQENSRRAFEFGYGYGVKSQFYTIMGFPGTINIDERLLRFSSPNTLCAGLPCGVDAHAPNSADAVLALNLIAPYIAGYRASHDDKSIGFCRAPIPREQNLLNNAEFAFDLVEKDDGFAYQKIVDWEPTRNIREWGGSASPIQDIDQSVQKVTFAYRTAEEDGLSHVVDPLLLQNGTKYELSLLMLQNKDNKDIATDYRGKIQLQVEYSDGGTVSYVAENTIKKDRYRRIATQFTLPKDRPIVNAKVLITSTLGSLSDQISFLRPMLIPYNRLYWQPRLTQQELQTGHYNELICQF